jgi:uncharacterized protein YbcV (DUF1398 family)
MIAPGANVFRGASGETRSLGNMGPSFPVAPQPNVELLKGIISDHQRSLTDYATLCRLVGRAGIEKWVLDL